MKKALLFSAWFFAQAAALYGNEPLGSPNLRYYYDVPAAKPPQTIKVDVCVYGGTPGGVGAAVQSAADGKDGGARGLPAARGRAHLGRADRGGYRQGGLDRRDGDGFPHAARPAPR